MILQLLFNIVNGTFMFNFSTLALIGFLILLAYVHMRRLHSYWDLRGVPYEKPTFLFGSLWSVVRGKKQIGKYLGELYHKYDGPYFGIFLCGKPYLVLRDPEIIKKVTIRDFNNFGDRSFACDKQADAMSGNSLFVIRNPDWKNIRNKLSSIFTSGKIKSMYPLMIETAAEMQKFLNLHDGEVLDTKEVAGKYMTDLVAQSFFGIDNHSFEGKEDLNFRQVCTDMLHLTPFKAFSLFCYFFLPSFVSLLKLKLLDTVYLRKVFLETLSYREKTGYSRNDFVDLLLSVRNNFQAHAGQEHGTKFDTTCMVSQAITFFMAGLETTSNLMGFAIYELSLNPDCQEKLRKEIFETFPSQSDEVTFDKVQQMKYLEMVTCETLRRYPFGPFLNRLPKEDYVIENTGLTLEKEVPILIPLDGIHFDPVYYKNPYKFDPERFCDGYKQYANGCIYMPFGLGPRNCIGERFALIAAKVGLIYLYRQFRTEECDLTVKTLELEPKSPFITPKQVIKLRVKKL